MKCLRYFGILLVIIGFGLVAAAQTAPAETALRQSAQDGDFQAVKKLLALHVDVNARDETGKTALLWVAPARDNAKMVELLVANGADVNAKDSNGDTSLMIAASQSNPQILRALIRSGANIDAQNNQGETALMAAAYRANLKEMKILLAHNANRILRDKKQRLAVDIAADGSNNYTDETNKKRFAEAIKILGVLVNHN